jgi:hypothetical protein
MRSAQQEFTDVCQELDERYRRLAEHEEDLSNILSGTAHARASVDYSELLQGRSVYLTEMAQMDIRAAGAVH